MEMEEEGAPSLANTANIIPLRNTPSTTELTISEEEVASIFYSKLEAENGEEQTLEPSETNSDNVEKKKKNSAPSVKKRITNLAALPYLMTRAKVKHKKAQPTHEREWKAPCRYLTTVDIEEEYICHVKNIRNLSLGEWLNCDQLPMPKESPYHINFTFDVRLLKEIWVGFSPCHTFIVFCFYPPPQDGDVSESSLRKSVVTQEAPDFVDPAFAEMDSYDYLCLSVEHRHRFEGAEGKPTFSSKLDSKHELLYAFCTVKDIINKCRSSKKYPYPIQLFPILEKIKRESDIAARKQKARQFLLNAFTRANQVASNPESYNLLYNCCLTNIIDISKESGIVFLIL